MARGRRRRTGSRRSDRRGDVTVRLRGHERRALLAVLLAGERRVEAVRANELRRRRFLFQNVMDGSVSVTSGWR